MSATPPPDELAVSRTPDELSQWRAVVESAVRDELGRLLDLARHDPALAAEIARVSVIVVDDAPEEDPDLLGVYHGVPVTEAGGDAGQLPPVVHIFLLPLVDLVTPEHLDHLDPDLALLREETVVTVRHEIAHHFGMEHDRLDELGLS